MKRPAIACLIALVSVLTNAHAQDVGSKAGTLRQAIFDPTLASPVSMPGVQVSLEGTQDDKQATADLGAMIGNNLLDLKLSGPVSANQKENDLVTQAGFANSVTGDLGIGHVFWTPSADPNKQLEICKRYYQSLGKDQEEPCTLLTLPAGSTYRDEFNNAVNWGLPIIFTARAKGGKDSLKWADPQTYAQDKASHTVVSGTSTLGAFISSIGYVGGSFAYSKTFKNKQDSPGDVCLPLNTAGALQCTTLSIGAPTKQIDQTVGLELRKFFGNSFGVNPSFTWGIKTHVKTFLLPIYVFKSKESFNGGVKVGWTSNNGLLFTAFIGDVFGATPTFGK